MEFHRFSGYRMIEAQRCRVQEISMEFAEFFYEFLVAALAINLIADDWVSDRAQMHANLMRSSRFDLHFEQGKTPILLDNFIFRIRRSPFFWARCHFGSNGRVAANGQLDGR